VKPRQMMILGAIFRCLEPTLTVAACLSSKPLFLNPMGKRDEATVWEGFLEWVIRVLINVFFSRRAKFATAGSDLLTDVRAFDACAKIRSEGGPNSTLNAFCEEV